MLQEIWGHRGCRGKDNIPENSIPAFVAALKGGAQGVELDVWLTKDGQLVVFHDETVDQLTDCPDKRSVEDFKWEDLKKLRLKDHTGKYPNDQNGKPVRIPRLGDLLSELAGEIDTRDKTINIEIKGTQPEKTAQAVVQAIKMAKGWNEKNFLVSSFEKKALEAMRHETALLPPEKKIRLGVLLASKNKPWNITEEDLDRELGDIKKLQAYSVHVTLPSLTTQIVKKIHDAGCKVVAWTCDEENPVLSQKARQQLRAHAGYADMLISDYPLEITRLIKAAQAKQR